MAGSPVRRARREAGIVARGNGAGYGGPAKGSWEQFKPGNEVRKTHGATLEKYYGPIAHALAEDLLTDPQCPQVLRLRVMRHSIMGWAEAEAKVMLARQYVDSLPEYDQFNAKKQGQAAPIEIWAKLEKHAANMRARVGLDPVSAMRLGRSAAAAEVDLARLNQMMAEGGLEALDDDGD